MKPIIAMMLCVQLAIFFTTAFAVSFRRPTPSKPRTVWTSFATSLFVVGIASLGIAHSHAGVFGTDYLAFGGPVLIGMALMCALIWFRERQPDDVIPKG
jgi:hypothetical protein